MRVIFAMGLSEPRPPDSYQQHGGQLLFQQRTSGGGYLYLVTGQEFVSSQNKRPLLGKINQV